MKKMLRVAASLAILASLTAGLAAVIRRALGNTAPTVPEPQTTIAMDQYTSDAFMPLVGVVPRLPNAEG